MSCRLCLRERPLCDSHIIPEFLYRPAYDEKRRLEVLRKVKAPTRIIQKGFREKLLCEECEALFAKEYEGYFAQLWYMDSPLPRLVETRFIQLSGIDYARFKLFHLSILWRSSVSSLGPFSQVQLGPYEEPIRKMLLDRNPGADTANTVYATAILFPGTQQLMEGVLGSPAAQRFEYRRVYMYLFGGCTWYYVPSPKPIEPLLPVCVKPDRTMLLPVADFSRIRALDRFFQEHLKHNPPSP